MNQQEKLHQLLDFNPETGVFTWKVQRSWKTPVGHVAGTIHKFGYLKIAFEGRRVRAHRLAWLYVYGVWPSQFIDHINGNKTDNRIANLREATHQQNQQNAAAYKTNTSGFKGVSWFKKYQKWRAAYSFGGRTFHVGYFECKCDAATAYNFAVQATHSDFAYYNTVKQPWLDSAA